MDERLIDAIWASGLGEQPWDSALAMIAERIDAGAVLLGFDLEGKGAAGGAHGVSPRQLALYFAQHHARGTVAPLVAWMQPGRIVSALDFQSQAEWHRGSFHQDWARPAGLDLMLNLGLFRDGGKTGVLGFVLPAGRTSLSPDQEAWLGRIRPHLCRGVELARRFAEQQDRAAALGAALDGLSRPLVVVARDRRVLFANQMAERILAADGPLALRHGRLVIGTGRHRLRDQGRLDAAIEARDGPALRLAIGRGEERAALLVTVEPLRANGVAGGIGAQAAALVHLTDPEAASAASSGALMAIYGLTNAEAQVAVRIGLGDGIGAAAADLGIAPSTVKTHLARVLAKTGMRRQAELAALVARLGG